ncbi:MAG: UDP-N-acetylmuramoyl-L-alanyl-D-glutamate--2,6-diaminopimelate ligase [Candidatus Omnitrophica bacterium]|nr:UDP-N-acetylmuramoyl-L-alanyl-D-glutamate--2,6-diaminopimelate ligase [Candidatus Omnitrophota bacterium]
MRLNDILKGIKHKSSIPSADPEVKRITCDSRSVRAGDMFIAFRGYAADGYEFIGQAVKNGAGVILSEKDFDAPAGLIKIKVNDTRTALPMIAGNFYGRPSEKLKMIGVTGTNGKTTVTYIIESILKEAGEEPGVIGTISYRINGKATPAKNTTPGPIDLAAMFADMVKASARYAVMEVSSHALDQGRVNGIAFDTAIFTNITPEHLDYHKTLEEYFIAKKKIFAKLKKNGVAVINIDDPMAASLKKSIKNKTITYGLGEGAGVTAKNIELSPDGSSFDVVMRGKKIGVKTRLIGRHNVSNILAAAAACDAVGVDIRAIKAGAEAIHMVPGRLEPVICGQPFKVFVDFAHTEDALRKVLGILKDASGADIITVFGCGGDRDRAKRPLMGRAACELSRHVIITSDNPRFEEPGSIIDEIVGGVKGRFANYEIEADRFKAIGKALGLAKAGSMVVVAGKGHEDYQIVKDKVLPFDDREVVKKMLGKYK